LKRFEGQAKRRHPTTKGGLATLGALPPVGRKEKVSEPSKAGKRSSFGTWGEGRLIRRGEGENGLLEGHRDEDLSNGKRKRRSSTVDCPAMAH